MNLSRTLKLITAVVLVCLCAAACGDNSTDTDTAATSSTAAPAPTETDNGADDNTEDADAGLVDETSDQANDTATAEDEAAEPAGATATLMAEVWADNWSALYVNGELIGEDSVPITTERSFNAEAFTFEATYPLTIAIEAKDFKETDSGIEYIGEGNQQMGDGGLIAQFTDVDTGEVVAVTNASWTAHVVHRAPLDKSCEKDPDPDATCEFEILDAPTDWTAATFDDAGWATATEWPTAAVGPKDGYNEIDWDAAAQLVWGTDLEIDNTVLFRTTVGDAA